MKKEWCEEKDVCIALEGLTKHPKRVRCPKCKKRFLIFVRECDDVGCYHIYIPKHKRRCKVHRQP